ncbi:MAG: hypothetical protein LBD41_06670 [Clostridiales Family XIII bacterium]|jgi:hypothetical protein|nr:hypothetical protein [Clostridiales Family XIII bacterium]
MKKFVTSLFVIFFIFTVTPVYLFAQIDHDAIEKVKTEAEAKELKRQASEEIKKIKENVKAMKKKAADDEDIAKKNAKLKTRLAVAERKTTEIEAEVLKKKAENIRTAAKVKEKEEFNKINQALKEAAKIRTEAEKQADVYQKNAMINPDAQNKHAENLLKNIKK